MRFLAYKVDHKPWPKRLLGVDAFLFPSNKLCHSVKYVLAQPVSQEIGSQIAFRLVEVLR